ncbi:signal transduction histidine kinase [Krasilnikovia cinnamomea]|uniref:histidine kinase n=1 Tax=Krasilnikovia cinnamomea TaxID=349313 RepID=A0A4Q7ZSW0_9ACTN|nr:histidine kinase [Krasilnikovia cinnamomea]RZU54298.1 signal transduction histidine kinase [Krasilnikovia cinnamomea]
MRRLASGPDILLLAAVWIVDVAVFSTLLNRSDSPSGLLRAPVVVGYAAVGAAALLLRRSHPVWVFAAVWLHSCAANLLPLGVHPTAGVLVALYTVTASRGEAVGALAMVAGFVPLGLTVAAEVRAAAADERITILTANAIFFTVVGLLVWGLGRWVRANREHARELERRRLAEADAAVAVERRRIARELHDIVAHAVTVMVLQAGGAQQILGTDAARALRTLRQIEDLGREAMGELRRLLLVLRPSAGDEAQQPVDGHQPGLDDVDRLVGTFREASLPVRLGVCGAARRMDRSTDLTAYRVVQEALTNVMKHAGPGTRTRVELNWADALSIRVTDDGGSPPRRASAPSAGHGLLGLQERVDVVGGTLTAGPTRDGGFEVNAALPVPTTEPDRARSGG